MFKLFREALHKQGIPFVYDRGMVQNIHGMLQNDILHVIEIQDHAVFVGNTGQRDLQLIAVSVQIPAFTPVKAEPVRHVKAEYLGEF